MFCLQNSLLCFGAFCTCVWLVTPLQDFSLENVANDTGRFRQEKLFSESWEPNVLIVYVTSSLHTRTLSQALRDGFSLAGLGDEKLRVRPVATCDIKNDVLGWADVILIGGPVHMGAMSKSMSAFVNQTVKLAEAHSFMRGKLAAAFSTGGAVTAGAELIVWQANNLLEAAGFVVPKFLDSWRYSTGLVAVTGEDPFCQVGQTDRFPHEMGEKAIMTGCEVGSSSPKGTLHQLMVELAHEYAARVKRLAEDHLKVRRRRIPESSDRLAPGTQLSVDEIDVFGGAPATMPDPPPTPAASAKQPRAPRAATADPQLWPTVLGGLLVAASGVITAVIVRRRGASPAPRAAPQPSEAKRSEGGH
mmetsp:Transcript_23245/g.55629  ORF Transcript_23245/g.55629 Transcript_23245/m.55629 type:complete len:360 (-) Transcript_23245:107-1186(-)